jgi:hypothetical protein
MAFRVFPAKVHSKFPEDKVGVQTIINLVFTIMNTVSGCSYNGVIKLGVAIDITKISENQLKNTIFGKYTL